MVRGLCNSNETTEILSTQPSTKARFQAARGSLAGIRVGSEGDRCGGKGQVTPKQTRPRTWQTERAPQSAADKVEPLHLQAQQIFRDLFW